MIICFWVRFIRPLAGRLCGRLKCMNACMQRYYTFLAVRTESSGFLAR